MGSGDYKKTIQIAEQKTDLGNVNSFSMVGDNVLIEIDDIPEKGSLGNVMVFLNKDKHNADNTVRKGIVRSLPHRFIFRDDYGYGADWKNTIQIEIGDLVWFSVVGSAESEKLIIDGKLYYIIPYKELIVAKRDVSDCNDFRSYEFVLEERGNLYEIVMLNGYVLVQPYKIKGNEFFKLPPKNSKNCLICFCGEPNIEYFKNNFYDDDQVNVGDDVRINAFRGYLEDDLHLSFNGSEKYMVVQRRHICYKY